ncbi:MAG: hypothetical protein RIS35_1794 [Pseudomonadota bacterium]
MGPVNAPDVASQPFADRFRKWSARLCVLLVVGVFHWVEAAAAPGETGVVASVEGSAAPARQAVVRPQGRSSSGSSAEDVKPDGDPAAPVIDSGQATLLETELRQVRGELAALSAAARSAAMTPTDRERAELLSRLSRLIESRLTRKPQGDGRSPGASMPDALIPGPDGTFDVIDVDRLREQRDLLERQRESLVASLKLVETELTAALDARRKADEAARLDRERLARAGSGAKTEGLRLQSETSRLRARIAELEAERIDFQRAAGREAQGRLGETIARLDDEIARTRPRQRAESRAIERLAQAASDARIEIAQQRERVRERIARADARVDEESARERATLRSALEALREGDEVLAAQAEIWRLRREAIDPTIAQSAARRAQLEATLVRWSQQLDALLRGNDERLEYARNEARTERARVDQLAAGAAKGRAAGLLAALELEADARERTHEVLSQAKRWLARALEDLRGQPGDALKRGLTPDSVVQLLRRVWEYELFSVSENARVDGRIVTVDHGVTIGKSIGVVLLVLVGYLFSRWFTHRLVGSLVARLHLSTQLSRVLARWAMSILMLLVFVLVLKVARIPLTVFAFLGGALAIGIGFGAQTLIRNLISGIIILFERKVRVGDVVTVVGASGTVTAVDLRATTLKCFDGTDLIIPNSTLLETQVGNATLMSPSLRREIDIFVAVDADTPRAAAAILDCARAHPDVLADPPPVVLFKDFRPEAKLLRLQYWALVRVVRGGPSIDSDLRFAIEARLNADGLRLASTERVMARVFGG